MSTIVKQNPEVPTTAQVEAATTEVAGPPEVTVTITDQDGNDVPHNLGADDLAQIQQRAAASLSGHPAHTSEGHWSNPDLSDLTDEEREADQKAYEKRFAPKTASSSKKD